MPHQNPAFRRLVTISIFATVVSVGAVIAAVSLTRSGSAAALPQSIAAQPLVAAKNVRAQVAYAEAHWRNRNVREYGSLGHDDCVNFASQSLVVRGWPQTGEWWHRRSNGVDRYSAAWASSTALQQYLRQHPELATALPGSDTADVRLGDLVQFDWDNSGNRDHTGIVTRIVHHDGTTIVEYSSHSNDRLNQSVTEAIRRDGRGGSYYFWHLRV